MDETRFWSLVEGARDDSGGHLARQAELLVDRLAALPAPEIAAFDRIWNELHDRAYTWDLWGAAYVLSGGCSDDCFDYFRAYLIGLGGEAYETGLREPDALAGVALPEDELGGEWEDLMHPGWEAHERVAGGYPPHESDAAPREPAGEEWDEDELAAMYPRLSGVTRGGLFRRLLRRRPGDWPA